MTTPEDFDRFSVAKDREIQFLAIYPVYQEEMQYKLRKGSEALFRKFEEAGYNEVIELNRKSVCKRTIWLF